MEMIKVLLTSGLSVVALFLIAKIMGHKQVSQLDFLTTLQALPLAPSPLKWPPRWKMIF